MSVQEVTITSGTTTDAIATGNEWLVGVYLPSGIASTTLTFSVCDTKDGTFVPVTDENGATVTVNVAASKYVSLKNPMPFGAGFIKLVFGSSETSKTYKLAFQRVV